jgi:hypothetical protein
MTGGWRLGALAVVGGAILPRLNWVSPNEDSGVIGAWAMQAAAGEVPYRDYFVFTSPGSILLYGAAFKVFDASFIVERALTGIGILAACLAVFEIGCRLLPARWAAAVTALWGVWLAVYLQYGPHHFWGTACLLLMALAVLRRRFLLAGLAGGLAVVFIQSAAAAVAAGLLAAPMLERDLRRSLLPMVAGGLAVALLGAGGLLLSGALPRFLDYGVLYTLHYYGATNQLPFPWLPFQLLDSAPREASGAGLWSLLMDWPLVVAAPIACAAYAVVGLLRWRWRGEPRLALVVAVLSSGLFLSVLLTRLTAPLAWFAAPLAMLLVAARLRELVRSRRLLVAPAVAVLLAGLTPLPLGPILACQLNPRSGWEPVPAAGGTLCAERPFGRQMRAAREFVVAHPGQQEAFLPLGSSFYLVTGETPPVPNVWIIPGLTAPGQLDALQAAMVERRVEWVFYFQADLTTAMPGDRALFQPGPTEFDRMLERVYERDPAADAGGLPAWRLRGPG